MPRLVVIDVMVRLGVLGLLAVLGYAVVRSNLRPLVAVETTAAAIAAGDLTRRVPESDPRTEVGRLARALNTTLGQIESAFRARSASEAATRASEDRMRGRQPRAADPVDVDPRLRRALPAGLMRRIEREAARIHRRTSPPPEGPGNQIRGDRRINGR